MSFIAIGGEPAEIWKPINGYPGYEVASDGRVRSFKHGRERILSQELLRSGYFRVTLSHNNSVRRFQVSRLILQTFKPGEWFEGAEAAHLDGNRKNNNLENLVWVTKKENAAHRMGHGTAPVGAQNPAAKLSVEQVRLMRQKMSRGVPTSHLTKEFNISRWMIQRIRDGRNWKCL